MLLVRMAWKMEQNQTCSSHCCWFWSVHRCPQSFRRFRFRTQKWNSDVGRCRLRNYRIMFQLEFEHRSVQCKKGHGFCVKTMWFFQQIIAPERRSTALSYVTLISHLCGDASGPYIIGAVSYLRRSGHSNFYRSLLALRITKDCKFQISDAIKSNHVESPEWDYKSLAYASMITPCMMAIATFLYFLAALLFKRDAKKLELEMSKTRTFSIS